MRTLMTLACIDNLALAAYAAVAGPDPVATHFDGQGHPDGWMGATANALLMGGLQLFLFAMFAGAPYLLRVTPDRWMNLPHRDYWLHPDRAEATRETLSRDLYGIGTVTFLLMLAVGLLALQANAGEPVRLRTDLAWWATGAYFACIAFWSIRLFLRFRLPRP